MILPTRPARSASLSSMSVLKTVTPTAVASGLPPNVEPCVPGVKALATSSVASVAPIGTPLASALATRHDVGGDSRVLVGPELAGAAHARSGSRRG